MQNYLEILYEIGLARLVSQKKGGSHELKRTEKMYIRNTNLYQSIAKNVGFKPDTSGLREIFFMSMMSSQNAGLVIGQKGDFEINGVTFEIEGSGKNLRQIKSSLKNSFLVKDDMITHSANMLPLMYFGFLY